MQIVMLACLEMLEGALASSRDRTCPAQKDDLIRTFHEFNQV
jgi:hypothetical protein